MVKPEYQVVRFDSSVMTGNFTPSGRWCETFCAPDCQIYDPNCNWQCAFEECSDEGCPPD